MENLNKETFITKVFDYENNKDWKFSGELPAIIDFWAPWCGPCRILDPVLKRIEEEYAGKVNIYKINVDDETELKNMFGIRSIPSILFIPMSGLPKMEIGLAPEPEIIETLEEILNPKIEE